MAFKFFDRVREVSTTTGTGAFTLAGAAENCRTFGSVLSVSDTCYYCIEDTVNHDWEVGLGTYSGANTLTRTTVYASTNAGAAVDFQAGDKSVFLDAPAAHFTSMRTAFDANGIVKCDGAGTFAAASAGDFPTLNQDTTGSAVYWKTSGTGKAAISGPAAGTTRTYTFPDANATIARTDAANTFTGHQTIEGVTSTGATGTGKFVFDTDPTIQNSLTVSDASDPYIRITEGGSTTSYTHIEETAAGQLQLNKVTETGNCLIDINPKPSDSTSQALFRFFRSTNTSGAVAFQIFKGDNSATTNHYFSGNGNSYLCGDSGFLSIGTTSAGTGKLTVSSTGSCLYLQGTSTDATQSTFAAIQEYDTTDDINVSQVCCSVAPRIKIASGKTQSGQVYSINSTILRNYTVGSDAGTLTTMCGIRTVYGHYNQDASAPVTSNVYGIQLYPYHVTGTITNLFDLYISGGSSGGTVTNRWSIYQASTAADNYLAGDTGIGTSAPSYQLHVNTDSAGKPGAGGLWTVVSDERIKKDIVAADLALCYDNIKNLPLKYFGWADGVYSDKQVKDKHCLGWVAQDVQTVFPKAVGEIDLVKAEKLPDGKDDVVKGCLDLNSGQIIATLYGAVQHMMAKVEVLEAALAAYEGLKNK